MIGNYLTEIISIALIIPLIYLFFNSSSNLEYGSNELINYLKNIFYSFSFSEIITIFVLVMIFKNIYNIFFQYFILRVSVSIRNYLVTSVYKKYLNQDIGYFDKNNSSFFLRNIGEIQNISIIIYNYINLFFEILIFLTLIIFLFALSFKITFYFCLLFSILIFLINKYSKKILFDIAKKNLIFQERINRVILENISNIKIIKSAEKENYFTKIFKILDYKISTNNLRSDIVTQFPRAIIEIAVMLILSLIVIVSYNETLDQTLFVASISFFMAIVLRLMPSSTRIIAAIQRIKIFEPSLRIILNSNNLKQFNKSEKKRKKIKFSSLSIKKLTFSYNKKIIFDNLNFEIKKNQVIGIIGSNGSGKTTLVNLIMGLINNYKGEIKYNDKDLNSVIPNFSYMPQNINLIDDSIKKNILFSTNKKKFSKKNYKEAINLTNLKNFIDRLPKGDNTRVGEKGSRVSGGELQKIGIARCIYNDSDVLIFDEFDNNLDINSRNNILKSFNKLKKNKIIILISHQENINLYCDSIYRIKHKKLNKIK